MDNRAPQQQQPPSTWAAFSAVIQRDLRCAFRRLNQLALPLVFLVIVVSLFPLAIDPDPGFLQKISPGVVWIAALLSTLLMVEDMYQEDYTNGTLELMAVSGVSLP